VVVRVRVEVKYGGRSVETAAVANSGYEAEVPELHPPPVFARCLEIPFYALPVRAAESSGLDSYPRSGKDPGRSDRETDVASERK